MKLYLVHCGFYDLDLSDGVYEMHTNFFVAARDFEDAKIVAKTLPEYKKKKMHVDGLHEISAVNGFRVSLKEDLSLDGSSMIVGSKFRELAPK